MTTMTIHQHPARRHRAIRRVVATLLAALAVAAAVAAGAMPARATRQPAILVPPRTQESSFAGLSDQSLWQQIIASGRTAVVGLKAPGSTRGVWKAHILLGAALREQARKLVLSPAGVTFLAADQVLPFITVKLDGEGALAAIRRLPVVDYVEPAATRLTPASGGSVGCYWPGPAEEPVGGKLYDPTADPTLPPLQLDGFGDVVPWNYDNSRIQQAWARGANGQGVTISVIDTGTFLEQAALWAPDFQSGQSAGRTVDYLNDTSDVTFDHCNHGTRMASVATAPRNSAADGIVGVAWKANLRSIKALTNVTLESTTDTNIVNAIRDATVPRANGTNVVVAMAFGDLVWHAPIADEIRRQVSRTDVPGNVLFVASAGTPPGCGPWAGHAVTFPGQMSEVVTAAGATPTAILHADSCGGPEVDLAAVIGETPALGRNVGDLIHFGGSSNATAIIAGVAALTWSTHPAWSADQVRVRLCQSAATHDDNLGCGLLDAFAAVGGIYNPRINGPSSVEPFQSYTLNATVQGDGPFTYRWSAGTVTPGKPWEVTLQAGDEGTQQRVVVTVTDNGTTPTPIRSLSAAKTVKVQLLDSCRSTDVRTVRRPNIC